LEERIKSLIDNRDRMRRRFTNEISNPSHALKGERKFLIEFEALIEKNLADSTLSVEKLSHELGMSRVQLDKTMSNCCAVVFDKSWVIVNCKKRLSI
jgi:hypothetical protein